MSTFVIGCCRAYRRIARAFPHQYRAICGDGLEQLGEDLVPRVWQQQGVVGLIRLFGDLALRLPCEHFSTWADRLREATVADDFFEGTWRARQSEASQWKVDRPAPEQAYLRFEPTDTGYLMVAYGVVNGEACAERPQVIIADGRRRPLLDLSGRPIPGVPAGAMTFGSRPDPQTLELGAEVDGQVLGAGRYKVLRRWKDAHRHEQRQRTQGAFRSRDGARAGRPGSLLTARLTRSSRSRILLRTTSTWAAVRRCTWPMHPSPARLPSARCMLATRQASRSKSCPACNQAIRSSPKALLCPRRTRAPRAAACRQHTRQAADTLGSRWLLAVPSE